MSGTEARGRLICFEGLDGAGKSTVAGLVVDGLCAEGVPARFVARKDAEFPTLELSARMRQLKRLIWEYGELPLHEYGDHHALYNMASWFSVLDRCKIQPLLNAGLTVVIDNWYFKFAARFRIKPGLDFPHVLNCFAHLTTPDAVVFLDVSPNVAAARKDTFARGECGNFDGLVGLTRENFLRYQESVRGGLLDLANAGGWWIVPVDNRSAQDTARLVLERLREHRLGPVTPALSGRCPDGGA